MIETNITEEDIKLEGSLRPQTLDDYIGPCVVLWTSRTGQDHAGRNHSQRNGCAYEGDQWPCD